MTRTRAERRHHHFRVRHKTEDFLKAQYPMDEDRIDFMVCRRAENRQSCSCPLCGNPRKHFNEKTRQEYLADLYEKESMNEVEQY
jgi:hypothetical protein